MTSNYHYLEQFIPGKGGVNDNWFLPLPKGEVENCEKRINGEFPKQLRQFYAEIGYGMLRSPSIIPAGYEFYSKNEILPPHIAVDYMLGIIEHPEEEQYYMAESTYEMLRPGDLPFFEIGDSSSFMIMKLHSENPNAVWALGDIKIEDSFERFIYRLYYESPWYYDDIIEAHYAEG